MEGNRGPSHAVKNTCRYPDDIAQRNPLPQSKRPLRRNEVDGGSTWTVIENSVEEQQVNPAQGRRSGVG